MREVKVLLHHDCPLCKGTELNHGVHVKELSFGVFGQGKKKGLFTQGLYEVKAQDKETLDKYVAHVKEKEGAHLKIVEAQDCKFLFLAKWKNNGSPTNTIVGHGGVCTGNVSIENGAEMYRVLFDDDQEIGGLMDDLGGMGYLKVLRIGRYEGSEAAFDLTEKQRQAMTIAISNGYYGYPRKAKLEELAKIAQISRPSFQKNLRKAEQKVIAPLIGESALF